MPILFSRVDIQISCADHWFLVVVSLEGKVIAQSLIKTNTRLHLRYTIPCARGINRNMYKRWEMVSDHSRFMLAVVSKADAASSKESFVAAIKARAVLFEARGV